MCKTTFDALMHVLTVNDLVSLHALSKLLHFFYMQSKTFPCSILIWHPLLPEANGFFLLQNVI